MIRVGWLNYSSFFEPPDRICGKIALLVVEVVSPGPENHRRDYIDKRNQYEWRGILEYWILDPVQMQVTVLFLTEAGYEESLFVGDEVVQSQCFSNWQLTAAEMLSTA
ncbi:MAG: Uma2 family endonuclease [Cyanobacteria bacterium P01_A01_bin.123]